MAYSGPFYWYLRNDGTHGYSAVPAWTNHTAVAGELVRPTAPSVGNERVFVCIVAGATGASEPTWTNTKGAKNTNGSATWQECTGQPGVNGDTTNSPVWTASSTPALGLIIYHAGTSSLQICSTSGAGGSSTPSFSATAGVTAADSSATWTSLGAASNFGRWAAPFARAQSVVGTGWMISGQQYCLVGSDHAETQAAVMTVTTQSAAFNAWSHFVSVDVASSTPWTAPLSGASITTTGDNAQTWGAGTNGSNYFEGITFNCGSGANGAGLSFTSSMVLFENCALAKKGTSANTGAITLTNVNVDLLNTTMQFGATGDQMRPGLIQTWRGTASAIVGATVPSTLVLNVGVNLRHDFIGVDLSAITGTIYSWLSANSPSRVRFVDCKVANGVTYCATPIVDTEELDVIVSDNTGTTYQQQSYRYRGTLTPETTIVRTGSAANDGVTTFAWKVVTTSNALWEAPFSCFPILIHNATTGSAINITIYGIWGGGAVPNNDDIWFEVYSLSTSGNPLGVLLNKTKTSVLAANAAWSTDTSTWGGSTTPFKMTGQITAPTLVGDLIVIIKCAKPTTTFYIDPAPALS